MFIMWKCTIDGQSTPLYSPGVDDLAIIDATLTMEVSRAGSFDFQIPPIHPLWAAIEAKRTIIRIERDGVPFWSGRVARIKRNMKNIKTVYVDGILSLLDDVVLEPYTFDSFGHPVGSFFSFLIDRYNSRVSANRRFAVGRVAQFEDVDRIRIVSDGLGTVWSAINDYLLSVYGGYIRVRNSDDSWAIDYLEGYPVSEQTIQWAENMIDLDEDLDSGNLFTVAVPAGRANKAGVRCTVRSVNTASNASRPGGATTLTAQQLMVERYGYIYKAMQFDTGSPIRLRQLAGQELKRASLSIGRTFSAVDLRDAGLDVERLSVGTVMRVTSAPHGIDTAATCTKAVWKLCQPDRNVFTIGSSQSSLAAKTVRQAQSARSSPAAYDESETTEANKLILSIQIRCDRMRAPEETLWAANWSLYHGWPAVECDIQWTADGVPVLSFDQTVNRMCGLEGLPAIRIDSLTLEQLRQYTMRDLPGYSVPELLTYTTFEDLCKLMEETDLQVWAKLKHNINITAAHIKKLIRIAVRRNCADRLVLFGYLQHNGVDGYERLKAVVSESNALNTPIGVGCWVGDVVSTQELEQLKKLRDLSTAGATVYAIASGQSIAPSEFEKLEGFQLILHVGDAGPDRMYDIISDSPAIGIMSDNVHAGKLLLERGDPR